MENQISIVIIEDHPEYREIVGFALRKEPDLKLVKEFGTAERALRYFQTELNGKNPDIILLDLNLPGMEGIRAIRWIKEYSPGSRIIVLTQSQDEADVLAAISQGASGYLLKSSTVDEITDGIRMVYNGGASLDSSVAKFILTTLKSRLPREAMHQMLTERELEVLHLMADGLVKKEIANLLSISMSTVVTHVSHIYEKLHVQNAPAAVAKAFRMGIFNSQ